MISSVLSKDEELEVNNAYANIGLIAGRVWAFDQEDPYRKLNQSLWVQYCKLNEVYQRNNGSAKRVRDVIPTSRLAQYGDYEYNVEREKMYKSLEETRGASLDQRERHEPRFNSVVDSPEPWMLRQVEEYFLTLISPSHRFSMTDSCYADSNGTEANKTMQREDSHKYLMPIPYTVDDNTELQLQARVSSKIVKDLWSSRPTPSSHSQRSKIHEEKMKNVRHCGEKRLETRKYYPQSCSLRSDQDLIVRGQSIYCNANASIRKPVFPVLSAEVPEFFPKAPAARTENHRAPIQFFPSSSELSYKDELFPYNRGHLSSSVTIPQNAGDVPIALSHPTVNTLIRAPHQWIQRLGPPIQMQVPGICSVVHPPLYSSIQPIYPATIIHRPINLHEKIVTAGPMASPAPIPVYQRPAELYQDASQRRGKNHQGVDFKNLILLTKNAMKARRNQSKNPQQASSFILESRQPNLKSETDVLQWLDKGYPKRAREFVTVNSLVSELSNFESKCDCARSTATMRTTARNTEVETNSMVTEFDNLEYAITEDSDVPIAKKRLYRDVLANVTSTDIMLETVLDKRYDELEQQAMEQYRTSEECLAIRYQELEQQALEQYKNGSSSSESIRSIRSSTMCGRKDKDEGKRDGERNELMNNGRRCLGFEKRNGDGSPEDTFSAERLKGSPVERQIVILRPDNSYASISTVRESTIENCTITRGTRVVTKSLTALNHATFLGMSGNKIKGASGDNMKDQAQSSSKGRHLILVTPLKQSIAISADAMSAGAASAHYPKPMNYEGISSGGGDEKVTVLDSPEAQVWLSSFWG